MKAIASSMSTTYLARFTELDLLDPRLSTGDVRAYARLAVDDGVSIINVNPAHLPVVAPMVAGSYADISVAIDYPAGMSTTAARVMQARDIIDQYGVDSVAVALNAGRLLGREEAYLASDLSAVVSAAHAKGVNVAAIIDTGLLDRPAIELAVRVAIKAGTDYVQNAASHERGRLGRMRAAEQARWMADAAGSQIKVKLSDGIMGQEKLAGLIMQGTHRVVLTPGLFMKSFGVPAGRVGRAA